MEEIIEALIKERNRQIKLAYGGNTDEFDKSNSKNDWIAYCNAYLGRAAEKVLRNEKENQDFRTNMIKVGALVIAALEANEKGYC